MIMAMTDERHELATTVRRLLQKHLPESELRQLMSTDTAQHPKIWAYLADMGLLGLAIPEQYGGAGYGWSEVGVVLEEAGRALLCVPFYSTAVLATAALLAMEDTPAQADLLPGIAAGECIATVALSDDAGNWGTPGVAVRATYRQGTWRLEGHANYVLDGGSADIVLVPATSAAPNGGGVSLFVVDRSATGLNTTPLSTLDLTRKQTRLNFTARPDGSSAPKAALETPSRQSRTSASRVCPPNRSEAPNAHWKWRWSTPRPATSSGDPSALSRP